jgi:hypothetical protein
MENKQAAGDPESGQADTEHLEDQPPRNGEPATIRNATSTARRATARLTLSLSFAVSPRNGDGI